MVISNFFVFFMNDNLDIWIMGFYRDCGTKSPQAGTDNINPNKLHQPYKKEFSPTIYRFLPKKLSKESRLLISLPSISFEILVFVSIEYRDVNTTIYFYYRSFSPFPHAAIYHRCFT